MPPKLKAAASATWKGLQRQGRHLYPAHIENVSFDELVGACEAKVTRFKGGRPDSPLSGRHALVLLPSGRYAELINYDDFPKSVRYSIEIQDKNLTLPPIAHLEDLAYLLSLSGVASPDKSRDGALTWR